MKITLSRELLRKKLNIKDGVDGVTPVKGIDYFDGADGKSIAGLPGKDGKDIDESRIEALEEKIKKLESQKVVKFGGGSGNVNLVQYVDLSAELNGVKKTFHLGYHFGVVAVIGSSTPYIFRPTVDYKESGLNIVFDTAIDAAVSLATGQSLLVLIKQRSI